MTKIACRLHGHINLKISETYSVYLLVTLDVDSVIAYSTWLSANR